MFQFPACPPVRLCVHLTVPSSSDGGFPHSDIHGSKPACGSPWLFAACHVLRRRMVPGHPPCALCSLIFSSLIFLRPIVCFFLFSRTDYRSLRFRPPPGVLPLLPLATGLFSESFLCGCQGAQPPTFRMGVGRSGLEPPTSRLSGECSNRLS